MAETVRLSDLRADLGADSPELQRFRKLGCRRNGPGPPPEFFEGIALAFAEERTCSEGHTYRGAHCKKCAMAARGWNPDVPFSTLQAGRL